MQKKKDQVEQEVGSTIATPFSAKAEEDAKRFSYTTSVAAQAPTVSTVTTRETPVANVRFKQHVHWREYKGESLP